MVRVDGSGIKWIGFLIALDEIYESQKSSNDSAVERMIIGVIQRQCKCFFEGRSTSALALGGADLNE